MSICLCLDFIRSHEYADPVLRLPKTEVISLYYRSSLTPRLDISDDSFCGNLTLIYIIFYFILYMFETKIFKIVHVNF